MFAENCPMTKYPMVWYYIEVTSVDCQYSVIDSGGKRAWASKLARSKILPKRREEAFKNEVRLDL